MKQFIPQITTEPFQLTKKDKCKIICVDFYEIYIGMVDQSNKLLIFALNTLLPLYYLELFIQPIHIAFGQGSQLIGIYSEKEVLIYKLNDDIIFDKKIEINNTILKFDYLQNDYLIMTQNQLLNSNITIDIKDPITFDIIHHQKNYNTLLLLQESIILLNNFAEIVTYQVKSSSKSKLRYDQQQQQICIFEMNMLNIFFILNNQIIHRHTLNLNIEKIQDGCFFSLPFYKQTGIFGDQIFIYMATTKGKLGSQLQFVDQDGDPQCIGNTFQEKKCRAIFSISKWGNNLLILFEQGILSRIKLYKFPQFEKLDFKFQYYPKNEIYIEQEDEFEKKTKQENAILNPLLFSQRLCDPYYSYIQYKI